MTVQQRIYHYMKRLEEACDEAAVERLEMVPKRHYESLENCVQRCSELCPSAKENAVAPL